MDKVTTAKKKINRAALKMHRRGASWKPASVNGGRAAGFATASVKDLKASIHRGLATQAVAEIVSVKSFCPPQLSIL